MKNGELRDALAAFDDDKDISIITNVGLEPVVGSVMEYRGNVALVCKTGTGELWRCAKEANGDGTVDVG